MSSQQELYQYIGFRINDLNNNYKINCMNRVQYYNNVINSLMRSKIINKTKQYNILVSNYNTDLNNLTKKLNGDIAFIKSYKPAQIKMEKSKKALLIGINYTGTANQLDGCINDVDSIVERISKNGFNTINKLTDLTLKKPVRENILNECKNLLINSQSGDLLLLFYSGHGSYILDKNGDEADGYDEMIVSSDLQGITDDELKSLIQTYLKKDVTLVAIFDSCFSGSVLDLKYQYLDSLNYDKYTENAKNNETLGNVFMISGCNDEQTSADANINNKFNGAMTWSLLETLKTKNNNNNISWRDLLKGMRDLLKTSKFSQIPQLSSGCFIDIDSKVFI